MGNFVRGLTLSVSGFMGMSLCMNYSSSAYSPYLVPAGLVSVSLGVVGFVLMASGMNQATDDLSSMHSHGASEPTLDILESQDIRGQGTGRAR